MIEMSAVPRVGTVTKQQFLRDFKGPARPVVLEELTRDWPARRKWGMDYFKAVAGDTMVPLYDSQRSTGRKHQHAPAATMPLRDYFDRLAQGENDLRMFFFNLLFEVPELTKDFDFPDVGLKLFKKLPVLFVGGKGARVQMHFDIDLADILLCHFGGRKRVMLFSPEQTKYMYHVPFSFSSLFDANVERPDFKRFPALAQLKGEIAELNHGDVLYIPPGYWHYVMYDEISFSMALRAFPRDPKTLLKMLNNLVVIRTIEGLMRKVVGQPWNDRNERWAVRRTHRWAGISEPAGAALE